MEEKITELKYLSMSDHLILKQILMKVLFSHIGWWEKEKANELLPAYDARWMKMIANATVDNGFTENLTKLVAEEFCIEYLQSLGYAVMKKEIKQNKIGKDGILLFAAKTLEGETK